MKGESIWKSLAILILGEDLVKGFSEGLIPKYRRYRAVIIYDSKVIAVQLMMIVYDTDVALFSIISK
ncbi:MAG: hypothetical protein QXP05_00020 [Ignisphaera sp.]|uniref:Uncharacterized protein n=1 Tax=Ignisphaera aggregans TaxID=334771 RepID=A0A7J3MYN5_9CREN